MAESTTKPSDADQKAAYEKQLAYYTNLLAKARNENEAFAIKASIANLKAQMLSKGLARLS